MQRAELMAALLTPLVAELAETRRQLTEQAERIGNLTAELIVARGQLSRLQATQDAHRTRQDAPGAAPPTVGPSTVPRRPWWQFWLFATPRGTRTAE